MPDISLLSLVEDSLVRLMLYPRMAVVCVTNIMYTSSYISITCMESNGYRARARATVG